MGLPNTDAVVSAFEQVFLKIGIDVETGAIGVNVGVDDDEELLLVKIFVLSNSRPKIFVPFMNGENGVDGVCSLVWRDKIRLREFRRLCRDFAYSCKEHRREN